MQISPIALLLIIAVSGGMGYGQPAGAAPAAGPQTGPSPAKTSDSATAKGAAAPAPINPPSSLLRPSLKVVQDMLNNLRLDRWRKGSVRDEASDHVDSLLKDMQTNLPPLLTAADAAPGSVSQAIPLVKHLDAFYDVLLRVEEAARVSAPPEQISALQQTMLQLNQSRLALDDHLAAEAAAQEKQTVDLQASVKTWQQAAAQAKAQVAAIPPPQPCKPATPAKKKPAVKKPAPATNAPNTPAKPSPGQPQGQGKPQGQGQPQGQTQPQGQKPPQ